MELVKKNLLNYLENSKSIVKKTRSIVEKGCQISKCKITPEFPKKNQNRKRSERKLHKSCNHCNCVSDPWYPGEKKGVNPVFFKKPFTFLQAFHWKERGISQAPAALLVQDNKLYRTRDNYLRSPP